MKRQSLGLQGLRVESDTSNWYGIGLIGKAEMRGSGDLPPYCYQYLNHWSPLPILEDEYQLEQSPRADVANVIFVA